MRDIIRKRVQEISGVALSDISIKERKRLDYQNNNLYDVKFGDNHWIAKEFVKEDEFLDSPKREFDALKLLSNYDVAPQPIDFMPYPDYERPVVIYEYMVGEMWNRRKPSPDELKTLAETWLLTHQATKGGLWMSRYGDEPLSELIKRQKWFFNIYLEWAEQNHPQGIPHVNQILPLYETHQPIFEQMTDANPTFLYSRSDPRFANIIARPDGRIGFVDWEDSGLRIPARTIADLVNHANQEDLLTDDEWQIFLDIYCENYPVKSDDMRQLIGWYRLTTAMTWFAGLLHFGVRRANQGTLENWHINGMPANQRLRRYLARVLSWGNDDFEAQLATVEGVTFFDI